MGAGWSCLGHPGRGFDPHSSPISGRSRGIRVERGHPKSIDPNGGTPHAAHVPQELPDPSGRAPEHQQALLVAHHGREARAATHAQQHGTSYDIGGFARTFRVAANPYCQGGLTPRHPNRPPKRRHLISEIASTAWQTTTSYASASSSVTPGNTEAGHRRSSRRRSAPVRAPSIASSAAIKTSALR